MIESKQVYKSFSKSITWNGVLTAESSVKPTISLKYMVTQSKLSASTGSPRLSASATDLIKSRLNSTTATNNYISPTLVTFGSTVRPFSFSPPSTDSCALAPNLPNCKHISPLSPTYYRICSVLNLTNNLNK